MDPLLPVIARFAPISLEEMEGVALQSRMDTKYLLPAAQLPHLLARLCPEYRLLEAGGARGTHYLTQYFDTAGLRCYFDHHNGRPLRFKVRMREYAGSGVCFLEVKQRTGRGGTVKRRMAVPALLPGLSPHQAAFVAGLTHCAEPLLPVFRNEFLRYTLVHRTRAERLTLDLQLRFRDGDGRQAALPGLCVAELKEGRAGHGSPFSALMRSLPSPPSGFSKYCTGLALLRPGLKHNLFKPVLLQAGRAANQPPSLRA